MAQSTYNRYLGQNGFRGVDFSSHPSLVSPDRLADSKNMWRDYSSSQGSCIESFPGFRKILSAPLAGGKIYGIFLYRVGTTDYLLIHSGTELYYKAISEIASDTMGATKITGATMAAAKSSGFQYGDNFFVLDGAHYYKISCVSSAFSVSTHSGAYIPCTYLNGEEYEQRNMLTNSVTEKYILTNLTVYESSDGGWTFTVTDTENFYCTVSKFTSRRGIVIVPKETTIGGYTYKVTAISASCFASTLVDAVIIQEGITTIGASAFSGCTNLIKLYIPDGVTSIPANMCQNCSVLQEIYLPDTVTTIAADAFTGCTGLARVYYAGSSASFCGITNCTVFSSCVKTYQYVGIPSETRLKLFLHEKVSSLYGVKVNGASIGTQYASLKVTPDTTLQANKTYFTNSNTVIPSANYIVGGTKALKSINKASATVSDISALLSAFPSGATNIYYNGEKWYSYTQGGYFQTEETMIISEETYTVYTLNSGSSMGITVTPSDVSNSLNVIVLGMNSIYEYSPSPSYETVSEGGYYTAIIIQHADKSLLQDAEVTISAAADSSTFTSTSHSHFKESGYSDTSINAILKCTISCQFDGRLFLTGNPNLPNTVFYSQRDLTGHNNPMYFGTYNYFNTGVGNSPNVAMIGAGSTLILLKNDTVQDGSINCYTGADGSDDILPRIYIRSQGLPGIGCLGAACNFADDPVFVTTRGLDAVGTQQVNMERTVQHRSSNVDRRLTQESLKDAIITEWQGYLVLLVPGGKAYLADSRQARTHFTGDVQYEWYYLDGFGTYTGDSPVYAYCSALPEGANAFSITGTEATLNIKTGYEDAATYSEVFSQNVTVDNNTYTLTYTHEDDGYYAVAKTGERTGGTFQQASCIASIGEYLIFGTESGFVCVINTDKRGTLPVDESGAVISLCDEEASFMTQYSAEIPRYWYSRDHHATEYYVALAMENAGVPHLLKNTIKRSCVLKAKEMFGSRFRFNVKTDREAFSDAPMIAASMADFTDIDFTSAVFAPDTDGFIYALTERKKKWVEKQYCFFSTEYCRPFGIYNVSYRYEIQGRIKNR